MGRYYIIVNKKNIEGSGREEPHATTYHLHYGQTETASNTLMQPDQKRYEVFEHTADVGIHAFGRSLPELFIHAAQGMQNLLVPFEQVNLVTHRTITVEGHNSLSLLIAWLNELIFLFDTEYLLFREFTIDSLSETHLTGHASGETYNREHHELSSAIKAVTWHEAAITLEEDGTYRARIIFDL
jgi:SHS2 domain-containing protein